jgi:hypothetical protein
MDSRAKPHPAIATLEHDSRVRHGTVPRTLGGRAVEPGQAWLTDDSFLLRTLSGYGYFYAKGQGVTVERAPWADPLEEALWLAGSVYSAIASIHGLLPVHASAVAWQGRVHAFSGASGAGKSTLTAALGGHGLPLFCDDTLVLDISDPARIVCLPGHKRLKLTGEAVRLTGAAVEGHVGAMTGKFYCTPPGGTAREALPLAELAFIEDGAPLSFARIAGAERLARLNDDHFTAVNFAVARGLDLAGRFALFARLAPAIQMARLVRPRDRNHFTAIAAAVARHVKGEAA